MTDARSAGYASIGRIEVLPGYVELMKHDVVERRVGSRSELVNGIIHGHMSRLSIDKAPVSSVARAGARQLLSMKS